MILILSEPQDVTTTRVCSWLDKLNAPYYVITEADVFVITKISNENVVIRNQKTGDAIDFSKIKSYWYRRGQITLAYNENTAQTKTRLVVDNLLLEKSTYLSFIYYLLHQKPKLDSFITANVNKLIINFNAQKLLNVPPWINTGDKNLIQEFMNLHGRCIVKCVSPGFYAEEELVVSTTKEVSPKDLTGKAIDFGVSYIQKLIEKKFEIRSFYLDGVFYSTAIFSQKNKKTQLDFRNYDQQHPNRQMPYKLPSEIEKKTATLIKSAGLDSCSVDFIYGQDDKIYFLEINPIGQYGPSSYYGNYDLEKKVAKYLMKLTK